MRYLLEVVIGIIILFMLLAIGWGVYFAATHTCETWGEEYTQYITTTTEYGKGVFISNTVPYTTKDCLKWSEK